MAKSIGIAVNPHDLMVMWKKDPEAHIRCPICMEAFQAELGVAQLCKVRLAEDEEYKPLWLIFCGQLCAWLARRNKPDA